jgi:hypothetical protein
LSEKKEAFIKVRNGEYMVKSVALVGWVWVVIYEIKCDEIEREKITHL